MVSEFAMMNCGKRVKLFKKLESLEDSKWSYLAKDPVQISKLSKLELELGCGWQTTVQFSQEGTKSKKVNQIRTELKKIIQVDPKILERPLTLNPKDGKRKSNEVGIQEKDPLQCSCRHCGILTVPIAKMTSAEQRKLEKKQCWNCHTTENLLKCAGCRRARYCSVECQTADRERHGDGARGRKDWGRYTNNNMITFN